MAKIEYWDDESKGEMYIDGAAFLDTCKAEDIKRLDRSLAAYWMDTLPFWQDMITEAQKADTPHIKKAIAWIYKYAKTFKRDIEKAEEGMKTRAEMLETVTTETVKETETVTVTANIEEGKTMTETMTTTEKTANIETMETATTENAVTDWREKALAQIDVRHNEGIITAAAIMAGQITEEQWQSGLLPEFNTFDAWKAKGFCVKKGEKCRFAAQIWKKVDFKIEKAEEETDGEKETRKGFIKKTAWFFDEGQVSKLGELPEMEGVTRTERNHCVWLFGNTRPYKAEIKAAGYKWSSRNTAWYKLAN